MHRRRRLFLLAGLLAPAPIIGCSLVYPYGDVAPEQPGPDASSGSQADDASNLPDQVTDDHTMGAPDVVSDVGTAQPDGGEGGVLPQAGAIVVSGAIAVDGGYGYVLSVLDPASGKELSREPIAIFGEAYDGLRDLWYLFEEVDPGIALPRGPFAPSPLDAVFLHVRQLDTHSGAWTELAKIPVPALPSADTIAALTNRLAYVAYVPSDAAQASFQLVVVDTTTPSSPSADPTMNANSTRTPLTVAPSQMIGTRPSLNGANGGVLTMLQNTALGGGGQFQFTTSKVGAATFTLGTTPVVVGPSESGFATAGSGTYLSVGPTNVFALPADGDAGPELLQYDPSSGNPTTAAPIPFGNLTSKRFRPLAVSECASTVFVSQVIMDTNVYAVPLTPSGVPAAFDAMNSVSTIRFEPYTNTAVYAFSGGAGYELVALELGGTKTAPTLTQRTAASAHPWAPPGDLFPTTFIVRQPIPFGCPLP
jgi:hypothetical protein